MEPAHKTTVFLPEELHSPLTQRARQRGVSVGKLVRAACESVYGAGSRDDRLAAVRKLASLSLPVDTPARMKAESVPATKEP